MSSKTIDQSLALGVRRRMEFAQNPELLLMLADLRRETEEATSRLPEEQRKLVALRFGFSGNLPLSREDAAEEMGITLVAERKLERAAISKFRHSIRKYAPFR